VLAAILSLASAHRDDAGLPAPAARAMGTIVTACLRGRGVIKSLLYFARKGLEEERPLDLNALVADITQLLAHTTLKRVRPVMDLEEDLPLLVGDAGALSHAVMNLCVNAVDAMERGGTLTLRTRREPGGGLALAVTDTGEGMAPEVLAKAMDPFFTTKPLGKGTGLGLSMAFGTMKAHGGALELRSTPGVGTEAELRFPASRVQVPPPATAASSPAPEAGRSLTILLVDDDELIREAVGPMLEALGHEVRLAAGGQEALDLLARGLEVDLVILDMNMPGITGAETLPRILVLRPGQRVIMASGYSDQDVARLVAGRPGVESLRKPYTMGEIKVLLDAI
jgi:CheY-like chemotaxis protein